MTKPELNIAVDQFVAKWNGKYLEAYDASNKNQCYDLITAWCWELGLTAPLTLYAYQIYDNPPLGFTQVPNTPEAIPQAGAIIVWKKEYNGGAGHTALATKNADINKFEAFSQNDPLGKPCILKTYDYYQVRGWLQPNTTAITPSPIDRRPYWFDRINTVTFKKPHEQVTDAEVERLVKEYPTQLNRSGKWDTLCKKAGFNGDSNQVTVDQLYEKILSNYVSRPVIISEIRDKIKKYLESIV